MPPNETVIPKLGPASPPPPPGTILGGRFEVVRPQAGGVLLGRDTATLASVVITVVEDGLVPGGAAALIARHVAELRGLPGVAAPLYAGRDGAWFVLVRPLVHGVPLADRIPPGGLGLAATLAVARDLLGALSAAHARGLVHLAITPAHVTVNPDGVVRQATLVGFGDAILRDCVAAVAGPADGLYAAPEVAGVLARPVDHRADLYSLGLVLHECLGGRPPFVAESQGELLRRRLTDPPPRLRAERPEIPEPVEAEILRLLAVEPAMRPAAADEVLTALAAGEAPRPGAGAASGRVHGHGRPVRALIGREGELAGALGQLEAAAGGRGGGLLLEGPAGIGKTRLLDELCARAAAAGAHVLRGVAVEHPRTPAGALDGVVAGLLELARADPACAERLRPAAGAEDEARLCALLPRLAPLLGHSRAGTHHRTAAEPVRWAGASALARLLAAAGTAAAPVLIVLDDCQWADLAVLELIAAWSAAAPAGTPRHAALIAAFRPVDLAPDHPLLATAAIGRIALGRLDDLDIVALAREAGGPAEPAARHLVAAAAAGNPARAELALSCLRDAGAPPVAAPSPGRLLAWRLELLSDDVRKLLGAGALLGREFSLDVAAAMLGRGDTWAALARADAERRLLIARAGPDDRRLAFGHDGLREALLAALPAAERRRLHARACDVLAQQGGSLYAVAWHALGSGDPPRAVPRALVAARAATDRQAPDVAELYLREARRHAAELPHGQAVEIVEDLAAVHLALGRPDLAEEQLSDAARIVHEPAHRATISASLARLEVSRGDHAAATAAAEAAIRGRGGRVPRSRVAVIVLLIVEIARLRLGAPRRRAPAGAAPGPAAEYALLARCYAGAGRRTARAWAGLRALRIAGATGSSPLLVECQIAHAQLLRDYGLGRRALAAARRAVTTATGLGDEQVTAAALALDGELLYAAGRLEAAADRLGQAARLLEDPTAAQAATLRHGFCDYRLGRAEKARETAGAVRRRAVAADVPQLAAEALGLWLKAGGRPSPTPLPPDGPEPSVALLEARGLELLRAGELAGAGAALERAAGGFGPPEVLASARAWLASVRRLAAEGAADPGAALLGRRASAAARGAVRAARGARSNLPHALRELGRLEARAGRIRRARRHLLQSLRAAERQAARQELAQSLVAIGEVGLAAGWPDAADLLAQGERALAELAEDPRHILAGGPAEPAATEPGAPAIDERLATLLVGGRGITAALSREAIYEAVCEAALPLLRGERAVIVHVADDGGGARVSGFSPACDESLARVCRALALQAASGGRAVAVTAGAPGIDQAAIFETGLWAAICAPVLIGESLVSCIYIDRSELAVAFGDEELRLAEFIAGMAGTALENAAGFAKVESISRSLEQRVEERTAQLADSNRQLDLSLQHLTEAFERERASAAELKHQAFHDPLTDLANRALFVDRVGHALEVARRAGHEVAVLFVDLDDFKTVNDSLGHPAGDELLVAVAARLRDVLRRADTASRLGGDEFGIVLEGTDRDGAVRTAERILAALEHPFKLAAKEVFVHASIGIALRGDQEITVDALLRNADVAMYIAKSRGKRSFEVFEQRMHDEIVRRLELKDDLHRGIELHQFVVHYQPIVDIATNRIHGLEALIRWNHPDHGMISPLDFVPLAEETGMIRAIGDWVLRTACEATRRWQTQPGHEGDRLTIGVNLSARELHEPGLVDCVAAALSGSGLAPADLTLEITESVLMSDTDAAIARLRELKALGVRLAIDDFGTGYSSLSYLKHLPVDVVKIDKEFVDDIAHGPQEAALAGAIVALSDTLHLQTVAEGIEHPDQLRALRRLGCDFGQGYLFARPAPADETGELLRGDRVFPLAPGLRLLRAV